MEISDRLDRIAERLDEIRRLDEDLISFGASRHRYQLNPVAEEAKVAAFESRYGIRLPSGYREFITRLGNGGAGPWYGLEPLEHGVYSDLDFKTGELDPSTPFPHEGPWNLQPEDVEAGNEGLHESFEEEYFEDRWVSGLIRISNYGCGVTLNLVVNGSEYGMIWVDDRCNDGGIYPDPFFDREGRTDFLTWYELWLERAETDLEKWRKLHTQRHPIKALRSSLSHRIARLFRHR